MFVERTALQLTRTKQGLQRDDAVARAAITAMFHLTSGLWRWQDGTVMRSLVTEAGPQAIQPLQWCQYSCAVNDVAATKIHRGRRHEVKR